jgi:hypothetical protein
MIMALCPMCWDVVVSMASSWSPFRQCCIAFSEDDKDNTLPGNGVATSVLTEQRGGDLVFPPSNGVA